MPVERTFLHLSLRPVGERELVPSTAGPWAVFGWTMIVLAATFAVLIIAFVTAAGPPAGL